MATSLQKNYAQNQRYLKLDPEAARLLDAMAPSAGRRGRFISTLIFQEHARREERRRIRRVLKADEEDAAV